MKKILIALLLSFALMVTPEAFATQTTSVTITINVVGALTATAASSIPALIVGQSYSTILVNVTGGGGTLTCAADSTTPLPTGLTLAANGALPSASCTLSGTLTALPSGCTTGSACSLSLKIDVSSTQ